MRLGIVPAVISPFVARKVGRAHVMRYVTGGEIFDGEEAVRIGLAHRAATMAALEAELAGWIEGILAAGPKAVREAKALLMSVWGREPSACRDETASTIARVRCSAEGQEGLTAFFEKRAPSWRESERE